MLRVLMIDDEKLVLDELENCIDWESLGFTIAGKAQNGRDGLALTEKLLPDVVITDVKMPVMDGLVYARKARDKFRHLKIIFISGYDEFDFAKQALSVEAFAYILKPVDTNELKEVLRNVKARCEQDNILYCANNELVEKYIASLLPDHNHALKTQNGKTLMDREYVSDAADRHTRIVEKALMILNETSGRQLTINELAELLYLSPSYLRTIFKEVTGQTVYDVQVRIKLVKAEKMLSGSNMKIKEVANSLGFEYTSHFIALFTKHKGMTPLEYRSFLVANPGKKDNDQ